MRWIEISLCDKGSIPAKVGVLSFDKPFKQVLTEVNIVLIYFLYKFHSNISSAPANIVRR